jgi:hypothetical protein
MGVIHKNAMKSSLDISRLEKVRWKSRNIVARCPACAATGNDRKGGHLFFNSDTGQFGCVAHPNDVEHRREIFALVGIKIESSPSEDRSWRRHRANEVAAQIRRSKAAAKLKAQRNSIITEYAWTMDEVGRESPDQHLDLIQDPRRFLSALFPLSATVWTGETWESGNPQHADRWRTVARWQNAPAETVGPMASPAIWSPGESSRAAANVVASPYVVLDFDGLDGHPPITPEEHQQHFEGSLAIVKWLRTKLAWKLAAVLFSGSKSIHAWFHIPPQGALASLKDHAHVLGVDQSLIGRPEHPCRLPGWIHPKTGKVSRVLWLQRLDR